MANWFVNSNAAGTNAGTSWVNAWTSLNSATAGNGVAAGDTIFVADTHAETTFTAYANPGTNAAPCNILCADHTQATPGTGNLLTTASIASATNVTIQMNGDFYCYGITFSAGAGTASSASITIEQNTANLWQKYEACTFYLNNTNGNSLIKMPGNSSNLELLNTSIKFGAVGQSILSSSSGSLLWQDSTALAAGSSVPSNLFFGSGNTGLIVCRGVDFSGITSGNIIPSQTNGFGVFRMVLQDCKLNSSATLFASQTSAAGADLSIVNSDSSTAYYRNERYTYFGQQTTSNTVYRSNGASDGTNSMSWDVATNAHASWQSPLQCTPIAIWNAKTGSNRNVTMYGAYNGTAVPTNAQIWFDVGYFGSASSPLESTATGSMANVLATGTNLTADTSTWTAPARQNTFGYAVGAVISVADNSGRLFYCTAASGNSAGSEPAGYASATDGSTAITDGSCTFQPMVRFSLQVTLGSTALVGSAGGTSPQPANAGYLYAYWKVGAASKTFYVDPLMVLS